MVKANVDLNISKHYNMFDLNIIDKGEKIMTRAKSIKLSLYDSLKQASLDGVIPPCLTDFYPVNNKKFEENKLKSLLSLMPILKDSALMDGQIDDSRLVVFLRENGIYYTVSLPKKLKLKTYHAIAQDYISQIKISRYLSHDLKLYLTNFDNQ